MEYYLVLFPAEWRSPVFTKQCSSILLITVVLAARRPAKQAGTTAYMQQNGSHPFSRKSAPPFLLHICSGSRPSGHQACGNHCVYAAEWRSPVFAKKCSSILLHICSGSRPSGRMREPLHICSRMEVAPFRTFFDMLKVSNCSPKQPPGPRHPSALSIESDLFDDFMCVR